MKSHFCNTTKNNAKKVLQHSWSSLKYLFTYIAVGSGSPSALQLRTVDSPTFRVVSPVMIILFGGWKSMKNIWNFWNTHKSLYNKNIKKTFSTKMKEDVGTSKSKVGRLT